tara:strand:+ start:2304 stop:2537 length:234 start_codon:yes stop_codon:yes gene_type:complete
VDNFKKILIFQKKNSENSEHCSITPIQLDSKPSNSIIYRRAPMDGKRRKEQGTIAKKRNKQKQIYRLVVSNRPLQAI